MNVRTKLMVAIVAALVPLASPVLGQHIPPHSNDPHPPANQPAYQLPSPLSRPGIPGYPGAAHSNDPHYRKTEPQLSWPKSPATLPPLRSPQRLRQPNHPYPPSAPLAIQKAPSREGAATKRAPVSLDQCYAKWDRSLGMSQAGWAANCRRLAADGRISRR